ncbi:iron complex outermembrane receptor protein [Chitinophaga polysaccharea]|uniref:Iron complex outermembrane receptor protein n=1 Tax=Chitinophaga polysaccharea TaxID=1293035 RepID=A0A561PXL9_9BACT|nr:TonB-dependent receptor [Chitinophaga polysaccharea]TWF42864.1 iron complex outermembrane receptor protein [Chitinophaga polysaccharea]
MNQRFTAIVGWFLSPLLTRAQDSLPTKKDSTRRLQEVVVAYQAGKNTPVTYYNMDMKVLGEKNTGQEPSFLLSETPAVTVYSDAGNQQGYSYYRIRGMDQTRINTTLDGMPLNEPEDQGAYFSNYPDILNSVSQLQLQRGVGMSKNGAASYAGSAQLSSPNLGDTAHTMLGIGYGSYNSFRVFGAWNSGIKNHKALYVRASQVYTDGYKYHAFNNAQSVFVSGGLFYDKSSWKINIMAGNQRNGMAWLPVTDSLIQKDRRTNADTRDEKDHFTQALVQLQNTWQTGARASLSSSIYYTYLKGGYDFDINNFSGLVPNGHLFNYGFRSHFTGFFSHYTLSGQHLKWTSGVHGNLYQRRHTGTDTREGELYRNTGYKNEISAFSKMEYYLHRFTFYADLQYRYAAFHYNGSVPLQPLHWQFLNPRAGVNLAVNEHTNIYYSLGRTGREPTRNDIFGGNDDLPADSTGKPLLYNHDPEYVTDHELGIRINRQRLQIQLNGYYMNFNNEIVLNGQLGPNGLLLTNNVKRSFRTGVELSASYRLNKAFSFTNNSSFNYSRIKEQSTTFSPVLTPALIINQEVAYQHRQLLLALSGRYQGHSYIDFANTATIKAYVLLNARIQYSLNRYMASLYLNNISGTKYYNNGSVDAAGTLKYFVQAPANVYLALKYSF